MVGHRQCMICIKKFEELNFLPRGQVQEQDKLLGPLAIFHCCSRAADNACCIVLMIYELAS
jgi:hypothetical protein